MPRLRAPSPELTILRFLAARTHAAEAEVGISCRMIAGEVRAHLARLESWRLVASRTDQRLAPLMRVFLITGEGRRVEG